MKLGKMEQKEKIANKKRKRNRGGKKAVQKGLKGHKGKRAKGEKGKGQKAKGK